MSTLKVFISYSQQDKSYKNELLSFLEPMVQDNEITIWHDQELLASDEFNIKIKEKLSESDIVIFLLSQRFITSKYCREIEEAIALEKYNNDNDKFRIIPIVLSPCTLDRSPLNKFNIPLQAKPVNKFTDKDDAYLEIYKEIKDLILFLNDPDNNYTKSDDKKLFPIHDENHIKINDEHLRYINDLGFTLQHSRKDNIFLEDIYIYPDLKKLDKEFENYDPYISSDKVCNPENLYSNRIVIFGDEQSGKTTLAKSIFKSCINSNMTPVIIKGDNIKSKTTFDNELEKAYFKQYETNMLLTEDILLIIDDFIESPMNIKFQKDLLKEIIEKFSNLVIISDSSMKLQEQLIHELDICKLYEIQPLGYKKRTALVEKWNLIGCDETQCIYEQQNKNDGLLRSIDSILMKNIVPSKPVFILMILQILETNSSSNFTLTSYGHCYHSLIVDAFNRANIRMDQLNDYFNYLCELAFYIYNTGSLKINEDQMKDFQIEYGKNYLIKCHDETYEKLLKSRLINEFAGKVKFQYKYIFYFFIAKKMTESENVIEQVEFLCEKIHSEKHANILIFITHHTKDKKVIDTILKKLSFIFNERQPARLDCSELAFLNEVAKEIPQMVIDNTKDVEEERRKLVEKEDRIEKEFYIDSVDDLDEDNIDEDNVGEINKDLLDVNRSYKSLEILGQIIRNRKGSMSIDQLQELGTEAYSVGLRFLDYYFNTIKSMKSEIIDEIHRLIEKKKNWSKEKITQEARLFYWTFSYIMSLNVIRKIALSVGHKDLVEFYSRISDQFGSEVARLIEIEIELEFRKTIPRDKISQLWSQIKDNVVTRRLLQEILINHLHFHYVKHDDKHWIASTLAIPIQEQNKMQSKRKVKELPHKK
ncbi:TIR domain-containing protein [Photobacterium damselae]|nr:TIR domain-containing protein [Photobacterium damselae]